MLVTANISQEIDSLGVADGKISRSEFLTHFKGDTEEVDYYMEQVCATIMLLQIKVQFPKPLRNIEILALDLIIDGWFCEWK